MRAHMTPQQLSSSDYYYLAIREQYANTTSTGTYWMVRTRPRRVRSG